MISVSRELQRRLMTSEGRFTACVSFAVSVVETAKNQSLPEDGWTVTPEVLIEAEKHG
jgi:hypothetical protein